MTVRCPYCSADVVGARSLDGSSATPKKGDYSVCFNCGQALIFANDKGMVRKLTIQEELTMPDEIRESLSHAQLKVKGIIRRRRGV